MSSNDETYLESCIESISSTLPHEIRRNMELLGQLDESAAQIVDTLTKAENAYIQRAQHTMVNFSPPTMSKLDEDNAGSVDSVIVPTTEELQAFVEDPQELERISQLRRDARQLVDEKVEVSEQAFALVDSVVRKLDSDLSKFESLLKGTGEFEATGAKPNDLAAIQVNPSSNDWILAKVISFDPETAMYNLSDEDVESNKIFHLPESQVVVLGSVDRLSRGDVIFAVYPDTTSFYQATVVQPPRKVQGGSSFVMVNFKDDGDEHGVTHDKAVLMKHIMRPPMVIS